MVSFGLCMAFTLFIQGLQLTDAAAFQNLGLLSGIPEDIQRKLISPEDEEPVEVKPCRFCKCRLEPNAKLEEFNEYHLCIRRILEQESDSQIWQQPPKRSDYKKFELENSLGDLSELLVTGDDGKPRLSRSLASICAGDVGQYDSHIRDYLHWRCNNGYGQLTRRWGRAAVINPSRVSWQRQNNPKFENEALAAGITDDTKMKRYKITGYKERTKRDEADDMRAIVEAYREWRSQNSYGQTSGRWG